MPDLPTNWTPIAVFSPSSGSFQPLPKAAVSVEMAALSDALERREVTKAGRRIIEVRAK